MTEDTPYTPTQRADPKYQRLMELGRGGMGVVHLAVSRGPRGFVKLVVLKTLRQTLSDDPVSLRMFMEEARISARLAHPNTVQVFEVTETDCLPTMVMEYLEGHTLWSILRGPEPLPAPLHLFVLTKVLAGLHAAHELRDFDERPFGLVHRDVSPHNVFVVYDGGVKVLDFGIAKSTCSEVETRVGELKGKIRYMAPEQLVRGQHDRRIDVFAVGVMMWEALARRRYWLDVPTDDDVITQLMTKQLPALPNSDQLPPALVTVCQRATAPLPEQRYQTADDFQRDLEKALAQQPEAANAEALAAFVSQHFAPEREATRRVIEGHIKLAEREVAQSRDAETRVVQGPPGTGRTGQTPSATGRPDGQTGPGTGRSGGQTGPGTGRTGGQTQSTTAATRDRPRLLVAGALLLALVVGVAAWRWRDGTAATAARAAAPPAPSCEAGFKACDGTCVSVDRPDHGCGTDSCSSCNVPNATARCNQQQACDMAVCYQDYDDCDGDPRNGCETNVRVDPDHCGGCGRRCPALPHAQRGCGDACTIWRCEAGFRDCDGTVGDGCEVDVQSDSANCGACGHACGAGQRCRKGECRT